MADEVDFSAKTREVETDSIKCSSCGGTMIFDPATQTLKCEHCGNTLDVKKDFRVTERDITEGLKNAERVRENEQITYKCGNCGAVVVLNADETATLCPFCGTSHIVKEGSFVGIRPQVVIPFRFDGQAASGYAKKWAKKRIFAPRKFKRSLEAENIHGVYEPCFTFDSKTSSRYYGRVGDTHTRTVGSGKNARTETYVVYRNVSGTYNKFFDDVTIATNDNFNQRMYNMLSPFANDAACVYDKKYLSGFASERYQLDLPESWESAKKIMDANLRRSIENSLHCDVVDYLNISTVHTDVTYKYVLLPVYFNVFKYKGKRYGVIVNGSTGKAKGKTPLSPLRVALAAVLGAAAAVGLCYLLYKAFFSGGADVYFGIFRKIFTRFTLK